MRLDARLVAVAAAAIIISTSAAAQVQQPAPPQACSPPPSAVIVRTVEQLQTELNRTTAQDIEIAAGTYTPSLVLKVVAPHRIWGRNVNDVVIHAGFVLTGAGKPGFQIRCLTLNASEANKVDQRNGTAILSPARGWTNVTVADSRILGNLKISRAIFALISKGLTVERTEISGFNWDGIRLKGEGPAVLRDLQISDIYLPGTSTRSGKGEHGIALISNGAVVERVRIRGAFWSGVATYAHDLTLRHLDVDGSRVGVYVEHYTHRMLLERFHMRPGVRKGVNFEWDDPNRYSGAPTSVDATIQDGLTESYRIGVAVMDGQKNPAVQRVTFRNQCGAAIVGNRPRSTGELYIDNDYSGIDATAFEITSTHPNSLRCS